MNPNITEVESSGEDLREHDVHDFEVRLQTGKYDILIEPRRCIVQAFQQVREQTKNFYDLMQKATDVCIMFRKRKTQAVPSKPDPSVIASILERIFEALKARRNLKSEYLSTTMSEQIMDPMFVAFDNLKPFWRAIILCYLKILESGVKHKLLPSQYCILLTGFISTDEPAVFPFDLSSVFSRRNILRNVRRGDIWASVKKLPFVSLEAILEVWFDGEEET